MLATRTDTQELIDQAEAYRNENNLFTFLKWYESGFHAQNNVPPEVAEILADMLLAFKSFMPGSSKNENNLLTGIETQKTDFSSCLFSWEHTLDIREETRFNLHKCLLVRHLSNSLPDSKKEQVLAACAVYLARAYAEFQFQPEGTVIEQFYAAKIKFKPVSKINFSILYNFLNKRRFQRAVLNNHQKEVELFLENKLVSPEANNNFALRAAALQGHSGIVKLLLQNPKVDVTVDNFFPLRTAIYFNHLSIVKILFESGKINCANINESELTLIKMSLPRGRATQFAVTNYLMEKNIQPVNSDFFPSICYGHLKIVNDFLEAEIDPAANNNLAICLAAANGHVEIMECLLSTKRVDPAIDSNSPLNSACSNGHASAAAYLLSHPKVKLNLNNLSIACKNGHADVVDLLLKDPRSEDFIGKDLLNIALDAERFETVVILMNDYRMKTPENFQLIRHFKKKYNDRYLNFCLFKDSFTLGISNLQHLYKNKNGKNVVEKKPSFSGFPKEVIAIIGEHLFADMKIDTKLLLFPPVKSDVTYKTFSFYQTKNTIGTCVYLKFSSRQEARAFVKKYKIIPEIWDVRLKVYRHVIDMQISPRFAVVKIPTAVGYYEKFKNSHPELSLKPLDKLNIELFSLSRCEENSKTACINKLEKHIWNLPENKKNYKEEVRSCEKMINFLENKYVRFNHDDYSILTKEGLGKIIKRYPEAHDEIKKQSRLNQILRKF